MGLTLSSRHPRRTLVFLCTIFGLTLAARSAVALDAENIVQNGSRGGAPPCSSCHGAAGEGVPEAGFPRLSGLAADYLLHQLRSFADGSRANEIMQPIASSLDNDERVAVANHYAGQTAPKVSDDARPSEKLLIQGKVLAEKGDWARGLPRCGQCHGSVGQGIGSNFPALAGQSASYIAAQLGAWLEKTRRNDPLGLMAGVSSKLSQDEVAAVAAYYASLPVPTMKGSGRP